MHYGLRRYDVDSICVKKVDKHQHDPAFCRLILVSMILTERYIIASVVPFPGTEPKPNSSSVHHQQFLAQDSVVCVF